MENNGGDGVGGTTIKVNVQVVCFLAVEVAFQDEEITVSQMRDRGSAKAMEVLAPTLENHLPSEVTVIGFYRSLTAGVS